MKKFLVSLFVLVAMAVQANAATWVAADRVSTVGSQLLKKNSIATKIKSGQNFIYKEPALQNGICEIWQPPKIG